MGLDWRIGLAVKPVMRDHKLYGCIGVVRAIKGDLSQIEILASPGIVSQVGCIILESHEKWCTA